MKTLEDIKEAIFTHLGQLKSDFRIRQIGIFGSYVRGTQEKGSDIDIMVEFDEPVSLLGLVRAENYLSEILEEKVDLVPKKDIKPELEMRILDEVVYL